MATQQRGRSIRVSEAAYAELYRRRRDEGRSVTVIMDRLLAVPLPSGLIESPPVAPAGSPITVARPTLTQNLLPGAVAAVLGGHQDQVRLCDCGHGRVSHRPKCLTRGCGCKAYRAASQEDP